MATQGINYSARDFVAVRSELVNFIKQYYPDLMGEFNDASIGMMLLELNAAVGDQLSYNTDRMFQETQLDYAQERRNILAQAKTLGLRVPGKKPSITIIDFSVNVPTFGDTYDSTYLPIIQTGAQVLGAGKVFETTSDIDFSNAYSAQGIPNRIIIPNIDSNQIIQSYTITKREIVINGSSKVFKTTITVNNYKPFIEIVLPDEDVIAVEQVLNLDGVNFDTNPTVSQFLSSSNRFYEVDSLIENKIFVEDTSVVSDSSGVKPGKYINITKKFITEYTEGGYLKLIFGGGQSNASVFDAFIDSLNLDVPYFTNYLNNDALGEIPKANSTLFVRYRVGGGAASNVGSGVLTSVGNVNMIINGVRDDYNKSVQASLTVNNPIPALGGVDEPSVNTIRRLISYNFASQNRCVTSRDYLVQVMKMDGLFGAPFRVATQEVDNKIVISILALDENGNLNNTTTSTLKQNIAEYLSNYRLMNDYVEISDGKIIDLGFGIDILMDKTFNQSEVVTNVINSVTSFMDISQHDMNENIYLGVLIENINNVPGVINVINLNVYNLVGGIYSENEITQEYVDDTTRQINPIDYTIYGELDGMFQILQPSTDITIRVKT